MDVCDLFVNPMRSGGGTSSVFALHKGKPVVTIDFGDVALNAGKEFCVCDYSEMKARIELYMDDPIFYSQMKSQALQRAKEITDTENIITKQIKEIEKRERIHA